MAKKRTDIPFFFGGDDGCKTTTSTHGRCVAISPDRIFAAGHPDRAHARLLSAAVGLVYETKFQGRIDEYDCSNYQLFKLCF